MAKVTGIGGVFFRAKKDERALAAWYRDCLGLELQAFGGAVLKWPDDHAPDGGATVWHLAAPDSEWFAPSRGDFMINYRVDDLDGVLEQVRRHGSEIHSGPETHENGRFAWVIDPDGNKVELWEPRPWSPKS